MKYISAMLLLIIWMVITFLLAISIIGLITLYEDDSPWMQISKNLCSVFKS